MNLKLLPGFVIFAWALLLPIKSQANMDDGQVTFSTQKIKAQNEDPMMAKVRLMLHQKRDPDGALPLLRDLISKGNTYAMEQFYSYYLTNKKSSLHNPT